MHPQLTKFFPNLYPGPPVTQVRVMGGEGNLRTMKSLTVITNTCWWPGQRSSSIRSKSCATFTILYALRFLRIVYTGSGMLMLYKALMLASRCWLCRRAQQQSWLPNGSPAIKGQAISFKCTCDHNLPCFWGCSRDEEGVDLDLLQKVKVKAFCAVVESRKEGMIANDHVAAGASRDETSTSRCWRLATIVKVRMFTRYSVHLVRFQ